MILLDAGVIGLICCSPGLPDVQRCFHWIGQREAAGARVIIPEITCYEVRRELTRLQATSKLQRLESARRARGVLQIDEETWLQAAEFWAIVRRAGRPTAHPDALDGDAILAALAVRLTAVGDLVTIATTNQRHLVWFPGVDARWWDQVV